jgi:cobalt-zinc-cadmium efflux system protein
MAMDAAPSGVDVAAIRRFLSEQPGVQEVHDLHVWSMGAAEAALTVHLVRPAEDDGDAFLQDVCVQTARRFGIEHVTIQIERQTFDCHRRHR